MDVLSNIDPTSSGVSSVDPYRPSFFELIAQEQLSSLLKPAIRYVLTVLAQRNPRYLLRIVNRFDEVYALIMLAINRHYLRTWSTLCQARRRSLTSRCILHRELLWACAPTAPWSQHSAHRCKRISPGDAADVRTESPPDQPLLAGADWYAVSGRQAQPVLGAFRRRTNWWGRRRPVWRWRWCIRLV